MWHINMQSPSAPAPLLKDDNLALERHEVVESMRDSRPPIVGQARVTYGDTRDILTRATGFIDSYDYSLNPYSGCSFGCTYCYAAFFTRSSELSDSWGYWVHVKQNAVARLTRKYSPGSLDGKSIYMSSVTDPYQPVERKVQLTRSLLTVLATQHVPKLVVQTRSPDVTRDCDVYQKIVARGGEVQINMTVTTDDEAVRSVFEPLCPSIDRRIGTVGKLAKLGLETCVTMTPLLWLNDADAFAKQLLSTGTKRFITQSFHFNKGKFVAMTRENACRLMAQKLDCSLADFPARYMEHYRSWRRTLESRLGHPPLVVGEDKMGFIPPF